MKFSVPAAVSSRVARQIILGKKHSPTILFAAGVTGMVATTVMACRATLQMEELLIKAQKDIASVKEFAGSGVEESYDEQAVQKDLTIVYIRTTARIVKAYSPAIVLGVITIAAFTGSHKILTSRNAGLAAAYTALDRGFKEYRARVVEEYGEEKDREFRYGSELVEIEKEDKNGPKKEIVKRASSGQPSIYAKFFDRNNINWNPQPEYNLIFLRSVQNHCNDKLRADGFFFLNDAYDSLGIARTSAGAVTGWIYGKGEGDQFVDFGIFTDADMMRFHDFIVGKEGIWLDFNVDGTMYDKI